ncbi:MAG: S8 family serine peptidase, partial [Bacteroidia bacterium]
DQSVLDFPGLMHVFSTGNSGRSNCGYGAGAGWGNITGGHKQGKNVISVANANHEDVISNSSSRGPAHDGRIKPDITAKGTAVYSTTDQSNTGYNTKSGTSMACPHVAASLAQLYQAYRELNSVTYPPSDLMKGVILNTADDKGNTGPDFIYGWGRINNLRAVKVLENRQYFQDSIANGGANTHTLTFPADVREAKIMIYWHDAAAAAGATTALVNDLDMSITTPNSTTLLPWILNPDSGFVQLAATNGVDHLNNMEQIVIANPGTSAYTIDIDGFNVPMGTQKYWIVYDYIFDEITVTHPFGGEFLVPGETEKIRWDAYDTNGSFTIEFSADSGMTWTNIATNVSSQDRFYDWTVPNGITPNAMVRVSRGTVNDESDFTFNVMPTPDNLNMLDLCTGQAYFSWAPVTGASEYIVYELGNQYMKALDTVSTTGYFFTGLPLNQSNWYSVAAISPSGATSRRAIALSHTHRALNSCFLNDLTVNALKSPLEGCGLGASETITIELDNLGSAPIAAGTMIDISFKINGGPVQTESYTLPTSINTRSPLDVSFTATGNFSNIGAYDVDVWAKMAGDSLPANDSLSLTLSHFLAVTAFPWTEDFESFSICGNVNECDINCQLAVANGWRQLTTDDQDWRVDRGNTPSGDTGPDVDNRPGSDNGQYIYTESSDGCGNQSFEIQTPCLDLSALQNPRLAFHYHMYGVNTGDLDCQISNDNGMTWASLWRGIGQDQESSEDAWERVEADLSLYTNDVVIVKFAAITGSDYRSDISLDAVSIYDDSCLTPLALPYMEDFDFDPTPVLPMCWVTNNPASVFSTTSCLGSTINSLQIGGSPNGYARTPIVDASGSGIVKVKYDYRAGSGTNCGNAPEAGETVRVDYWDGNIWANLTQYDGANAPQVFTSDSFFVSQGLSAEFQLRFLMEDGSAYNADNFNFDNVSIETICIEQKMTVDADICVGDVYTLPSGLTTRNTGTHIDTLQSLLGCDSIITTNVTVGRVNTIVTQNGTVLRADAATASYQWIDCATNAPIAGATTDTFEAILNGQYAVIITENGCSDTSTCFTVNSVGLQNAWAASVSVYPNPSTGIFMVELGENVPSIQSIRVID